MISLTSNPKAVLFIEGERNLLRVEYNAEGKLKKMFLVDSKESKRSLGPRFDVRNFDNKGADFKVSGASSGYYSIGTEKPDEAAIYFGTVWEDTQSLIKYTTFEKWVEECAEVMLGKREGIVA
jgi:hypothetical protein